MLTKWLLYALIGLGITTAAGIGGTYYFRHQLQLADAKVELIEGKLERTGEMASTLVSFNEGHQRNQQALSSALRSCQAGVRISQQQNESAVAKALAKARDSDETFRKFIDQLDKKPPSCEIALKNLDTACASLAGY